jgi:hypothetical protein
MNALLVEVIELINRKAPGTSAEAVHYLDEWADWERRVQEYLAGPRIVKETEET